MRRLAIALVMGCGSSAPTTPAPTASPVNPPRPHFLLEKKGSLEFYAVSGGTVTRTREVKLPTGIATLAWSRKQPVLLLGTNVARVTDTGLEMLPVPPPDTWKHPKPASESAEHQDNYSVKMFTKDDEVWLSKCEWSEQGLYSVCSYWINARLDPAPMITEQEGRSEIFEPIVIGKPLKPVAPPASIRAALVPDQERHEGKREKLQCADGATTIEDPELGTPLEPQFDNATDGGRSDLVWLSAEPPIFQVTDWDNCRPCPVSVIFERCKRSERYGDAQFARDDVILFWNSRNLIVFQHGRELATFEDVSLAKVIPE